MNEGFKPIFSEDKMFKQPNVAETHEGFQEVIVQKQDVGKLLGNLDIRKAMGPDRVSGWTLSECKDHLIQPIWEGATKVEKG